MTEQQSNNLLELLQDYHSASLSLFQRQSPFLNGQVINSAFNNAGIGQYYGGDVVEYDILNCKNFPVQLTNMLCENYEVKSNHPMMPVKDFMEMHGTKNTILLAKKVQKLIISELLRKIKGCRKYGKDIIIDKKKSLIAHEDFIEEHEEFFNKFKEENPEKELIYKWHILTSKYLDVYQCNYLPTDKAILFDDRCLCVPICPGADNYPFPSALKIDPEHKIGFSLIFGNVPTQNYRAFNCVCSFGVEFLPTHMAVLKL
jgi:hypothetical protein